MLVVCLELIGTLNAGLVVVPHLNLWVQVHKWPRRRRVPSARCGPLCGADRREQRNACASVPTPEPLTPRRPLTRLILCYIPQVDAKAPRLWSR